jgi:hypothetical protein
LDAWRDRRAVFNRANWNGVVAAQKVEVTNVVLPTHHHDYDRVPVRNLPRHSRHRRDNYAARTESAATLVGIRRRRSYRRNLHLWYRGDANDARLAHHDGHL